MGKYARLSAANQALLNQMLAVDAPPIIEIDELQPTDWIDSLRRAGMFAVVIDRAPIYNKDTLLHAIYQNCEFPAFFGFNWDALHDSLSDFSWRQAQGYVLLYKKPKLLRQKAPEDYAQFLEVIRETAEHMAKQETPFKLVMAK